MNSITPAVVKEWLEEYKPLALIDVREPWEHQAYNIGGTNIPMGDLMARRAEIPKDADVIIYCEKGIRSVIAIQRLQDYGYTNLYNLQGGMAAWRNASGE